MIRPNLQPLGGSLHTLHEPFFSLMAPRRLYGNTHNKALVKQLGRAVLGHGIQKTQAAVLFIENTNSKHVLKDTPPSFFLLHFSNTQV